MWVRADVRGVGCGVWSAITLALAQERAKAANQLVGERFLLQRDADLRIQRAAAASVSP
jgi:hypothetical protein